MSEFDLKLIYSSRTQVIEALNQKATQNIDDIFLDKDIELIINTAPNEYHYEYTKRALQNGKHVLVEKPFVTDSKQGAELIELAIKNGLILTVFHNRRLDADFLTIKALLEQKKIGELKIFESHYDRMRPNIRENKWKEKPGPGTGILYDLGVHLIDQTLTLFGRPESITSDLESQKDNNGVTDYFHIVFKYKEMRVILHSSSFGELSPRFHLQGSHGQFVKYGFDPQELRLVRGDSPLSGAIGVEDEAHYGELTLWSGEEARTCSHPSEAGEYIKFYRNLANSIHGSEKPMVKALEALEAIKMIEICIESSKLRKTIVLTNKA